MFRLLFTKLTIESLIAVLGFGLTCFGLGLTFGLLFKAKK